MFRTRWALATLVVAGLLGGCSDDDPEPDIGSDPTASSPTAVGERESVADGDADGGRSSAEDTVTAWVAGAERGACRTGDTTASAPFERM